MYKAIGVFLKKLVSSLFFIGYIPFMPGTIGSAVTVVLLWYFKDTLTPYFLPEFAHNFILLYCALIGISIFFANNAEQLYGKSDPGQIIIDECLGQLITFFLLPLSIPVLILGLCYFRFFDIVKPFPVYKFEQIEDGTGIIMDDVIAGILSNIALTATLWIYHGIAARL